MYIYWFSSESGYRRRRRQRRTPQYMQPLGRHLLTGVRIDEWRKRPEAVVNNNRGHTEHLYKLFERFYRALIFKVL